MNNNVNDSNKQKETGYILKKCIHEVVLFHLYFSSYKDSKDLRLAFTG